MELYTEVDRAGFPMVWVEPIGAYIHWLPVTKIQIEYFLCSTNETAYGEDWYKDILGFNDRVSPGSIHANNYWRAIATGILPRDAKRFAQWCGSSYDLPTAKEWFATYEHFSGEEANPGCIETLVTYDKLKPRTRMLIQGLEYATNQESFQLDGGRRMSDQMLMRLGVMEYVYNSEGRNSFGGYGQTNSHFFGSMYTPMRDFPEQIGNPQEGARMKHYGFRLIRRR